MLSSTWNDVCGDRENDDTRDIKTPADIMIERARLL